MVALSRRDIWASEVALLLLLDVKDLGERVFCKGGWGWGAGEARSGEGPRHARKKKTEACTPILTIKEIS